MPRSWRREYNEERPKRILDGLTPAEYARRLREKAITIPENSQSRVLLRVGERHYPQKKDRCGSMLHGESTLKSLMTIAGRALLAAGVIGLGILELVNGVFVRKWQPVPADIPMRQWAVWVSGLLLLACGAGLLLPRASRPAALALTLFLASWIVVLHGPLIAAQPGSLLAWGYLCGVLTMATGTLALWAMLPSRSSNERADGSSRVRTLKVARLLMAPALVLFGISHIINAQSATTLVPSWLPVRTGLVYFTGCAHIGAGFALIAGFLAPLAAVLEAAMMSSFVLLVDIPRFAGGLVHGPPWAISFETAMTGAVWIVAASLRGPTAHRSINASRPVPAAE